MSDKLYEVLPRPDGRFVISGPATGHVLDHAQGHGYASRQKAERAGWYKFKGGKAKQDAASRVAKTFWRANEAFRSKVSDLELDNFKEYARGECNFDEDVAALIAEMGVIGYDSRFLKYL